MPQDNWNENVSRVYTEFKSQGGSLLTQIYPQIKNLELFKQDTSVLAIGPGSGHVEVELAIDYNAQLTLVEPSKLFTTDFEKQIQKLNLQKNVAHIFNDKFENYFTDAKFDLILAVHSWHYIGLDINQLKKAVSMLSPGGIFCIAQTSEKAFTKDLKDLLYPDGHFFINVEELSRFCHENDLNHKLIIVPKLLPFSRYIENNQLTPYTKSWLSFMGRRNPDEILSSVRSQAIEILKKYESNGFIDDAWGVVLFEKI